MVHNFYQQRGGEDIAFHAEKALLESNGHQVPVYIRQNDEIKRYGPVEKASLPFRTVWAWDSSKQMRKLVDTEKPDVVHFHNTFPLVSPSAYSACREANIPVVQSLDNPRLMCPAATLFREGSICEECVGKIAPWPGVLHACYRKSRLQTGVVAAMLTVHRYLKTWEKLVDTYLVATDFYHQKFVDAGLPPEKIAVKPHFIAPDPGPTQEAQSYALFAGRLSPEKGVLTLLNAWEKLKAIPLKIRGEGDLLRDVQERASDRNYQIEMVPRLSRQELTHLFQRARFLVWPSEGYYETFGLVAVEAFACGIPVIASRVGVMEEIVRDRVTGLHFKAGDPNDLAEKVEWAWTHPREMETMGREARSEYEVKYTAERNYELLMGVYRRALRGK